MVFLAPTFTIIRKWLAELFSDLLIRNFTDALNYSMPSLNRFSPNSFFAQWRLTEIFTNFIKIGRKNVENLQHFIYSIIEIQLLRHRFKYHSYALHGSTREFSKPDFIQIVQQMWKIGVAVLVKPSLKCDCNRAEVHETYARSANYCKEFRHRILRRSDKRFCPQVTDRRTWSPHKALFTSYPNT